MYKKKKSSCGGAYTLDDIYCSRLLYLDKREERNSLSKLKGLEFFFMVTMDEKMNFLYDTEKHAPSFFFFFHKLRRCFFLFED